MGQESRHNWPDLVTRYKKSGQTQAAFAKANKINHTTLSYYFRQYERFGMGGTPKNPIGKTAKQTNGNGKQPLKVINGFLPVGHHTDNTQEMIEMTSKTGITIKVPLACDVATMQNVIKALELAAHE